MTSAHRGEVLQLDASLLKRTFTIREFARHAGCPRGTRQRELRSRLHRTTATGSPRRQASGASSRPGSASVRHLALAPEAADNDVVDPYRRSAEYYSQMEDELAPAIISVLRFARLNTPG